MRNISLDLINVSLELRNVSLDLINVSLELRNVRLELGNVRLRLQGVVSQVVQRQGGASYNIDVADEEQYPGAKSPAKEAESFCYPVGVDDSTLKVKLTLLSPKLTFLSLKLTFQRWSAHWI